LLIDRNLLTKIRITGLSINAVAKPAVAANLIRIRPSSSTIYTQAADAYLHAILALVMLVNKL